MENNVTNETKKQEKDEFKSILEEVIREGARKMLQAAIEQEVTDYINSLSDKTDEKGRRMVIRSGYLPERSILTGIGPIKIKQPRVRDKREQKDVLFTFYDFPSDHWIHIRSTNVIESTFATVRLRTDKTKGCGTRLATLTMVYKLAREAKKVMEKDKGIQAHTLLNKWG